MLWNPCLKKQKLLRKQKKQKKHKKWNRKISFKKNKEHYNKNKLKNYLNRILTLSKTDKVILIISIQDSNYLFNIR
jgi:hypothetical protein